MSFDTVPTISADSLRALRSTLNNLKDKPEFIVKNADRLNSADIAFFAFNASLQDIPNEDFHPAFHAFREGSRDRDMRARIIMQIRRAVFDHAALLDQLTGGTTFVAHFPGAMEPHTPATSEYIKSYVYVPGAILKELERQGGMNSVPDIVQLLIRELGVPTVERFDRIRKRVWGATRRPSTLIPRPLPQLSGMPLAMPEGSGRYLFYGQKFETRMQSDIAFGFWVDFWARAALNESEMATRPTDTTRSSTLEDDDG